MKYSIVVNYAAGTGRVVPLDGKDHRRQYESYLEPVGKKLTPPAFTHDEAQEKLDELFPIKFVVTYNVGEDRFYLHEVTQGNYKGSMFGHETFCAEFENKEDAEAYVKNKKERD
jgi:hypothetical protein